MNLAVALVAHTRAVAANPAHLWDLWDLYDLGDPVHKTEDLVVRGALEGQNLQDGHVGWDQKKFSPVALGLAYRTGVLVPYVLVPYARAPT